MSEIARTVDIPETLGFEFRVQIGRNTSGNRVILVQMRETDARSYVTVIEMDVDLSSLYRDTVTGFVTPEPRR
jgi:hypothetical protein